jgi:aromatic ring-opening dioxygenase catalytic subunit (LigB family)
MSLPEISRVMNISYDTLYKDQCFLMQQARENMKNHIADLPFNIKQATYGLNRLISMLYDIQDLDVIKAQGRDRKTSDHVRVIAIGLIKDCIKEKIDILTSQGAISHALDFIENAKRQIKEEFNEDMQQVIEQDMDDSAAINDVIGNNPEIQSYNPGHANSGPSSTTTTASEQVEQ